MHGPGQKALSFFCWWLDRGRTREKIKEANAVDKREQDRSRVVLTPVPFSLHLRFSSCTQLSSHRSSIPDARYFNSCRSTLSHEPPNILVRRTRQKHYCLDFSPFPIPSKVIAIPITSVQSASLLAIRVRVEGKRQSQKTRPYIEATFNSFVNFTRALKQKPAALWRPLK